MWDGRGIPMALELCLLLSLVVKICYPLTGMCMDWTFQRGLVVLRLVVYSPVFPIAFQCIAFAACACATDIITACPSRGYSVASDTLRRRISCYSHALGVTCTYRACVSAVTTPPSARLARRSPIAPTRPCVGWERFCRVVFRSNTIVSASGAC